MTLRRRGVQELAQSHPGSRWHVQGPGQLPLTWKPVPTTSLPLFLSILNLLYKNVSGHGKRTLLLLGLMSRYIFQSILQ